MTFEDKTTIDFEPHEAKNAVDVRASEGWNHAVVALKQAFEYIELRLKDDPSVDEPYRLKAVYDMFKAVRVFDPSYVRQGKVDPTAVDNLETLHWVDRDCVCKLQTELPEYLVAVNESTPQV